MNAYLSGIGFSSVRTAEAIEALIADVTSTYAGRTLFTSEDGRPLVQYVKAFAKDCGLAVVGQVGSGGHFHAEYYRPYFRSHQVSLTEELSIEYLTDKDAYACACEDPRLGFTLIFSLNNMAEFLLRLKDGHLRGGKRVVALSGIALEGAVLLPVRENKKAEKIRRDAARERKKLMDAAREGDEDAMESLSMEEVDTYSMISKRLAREDILTIVETSFMPCGVECDQYQILGNIETCQYVRNAVTGEMLCQMLITCNDIPLRVCINTRDLTGMPAAGCRFRGRIFLQGEVVFE